MKKKECKECSIPQLSAKVWFAKRYHDKIEQLQVQLEHNKMLLDKVYKRMSVPERKCLGKEVGYLE